MKNKIVKFIVGAVALLGVTVATGADAGWTNRGYGHGGGYGYGGGYHRHFGVGPAVGLGILGLGLGIAGAGVYNRYYDQPRYPVPYYGHQEPAPYDPYDSGVGCGGYTYRPVFCNGYSYGGY